MKTFLLKILGIIFISFTWIACSDEDDNNNFEEGNLVEENATTCIAPELTIQQRSGLDITVIPSGFDDQNITNFSWTVNGIEENSFNENMTLFWGPENGDTQFCFTIFTENCPEGIEACVIFRKSSEQTTIANTSVDGRLPEISVIEIEEAVFTYEFESAVTGTSECTTPELTIQQRSGLDITVIPSGFDDQNITNFSWTVNGIEENSFNENMTLFWGPENGDTQFCLTIFTENCPDGIEACVIFRKSSEQTIIANTSVDGSLPEISVIEIEEGVFTYEFTN